MAIAEASEKSVAETGKTRDGQLKARRAQTLRVFSCIFLLHMSSQMMVIDSKMLAWLRHFKGDTARYAQVTSRATVLLRGSSMVLAPLLAVASDVGGRLPLLWLGALWSLMLRCADILSPAPATLFATTSLASLTQATMQGVFTAISDLFPGDPKGAGGAQASVQAGMQVAQVLTPTLASGLAARDLRLPMVVSIALSLAQLPLIAKLDETQPASERLDVKQVSWATRANPASFLRLFVQDRRMTALSLAQFVAFLSDPMMTARTSLLVYQESLGWKVQHTGRYTSFSSVLAIPGFAYAGVVLKKFGSQGALALGSAAVALHHILDAWWVQHSWQQMAITPLLAARGISMASLSGLLNQAGRDAGLGQAELRGCLNNLSHVAGVLGTMFWASWYTRCIRDGKPRRFFAAIAASVVLSGVLAQFAAALPAPKKEISTDRK